MSDRNQKPANMSENDVKNDIMQRWKLSYDSKNDIESKESMKLFEAPNLPQFKSRYSQSDVDEAEDKYLNMPDESLTEEVDEEYEQEEFADVKEISERNDQNPSQYEDDFDYTESKGNDDDDDNDNLNSTNLASESSCAFLRQVSKDECSSTPALSPRSYKSDSDEEVDEQEVDESIPDQKLESLVPLKLTEYSIAMNIDTGTEEFRRQISKDEYAMTPVVSPREYEASDDGGDKDDDDAVNILNNDSNIDPTPTVHLIQESLASSLRASAVGALADLALLVEKSHPTLPSSRISTHTGSPRGEISRLNAHKLPSVTSSIVTTTAISTQEPIKNAYDEVDQLVNDIKQDEKDGSSELSNVQTKPGIDTETNRLTKSNISPTRKSRPDVSQQSRLSLLRKKLTSSSSASTAVAAPTHVSKSKAMSAINTKTAITTTSPSRSKSPQVTPSKIPKPTTSLTPSSTTKATPYLTTATASTGSRVRTKQACTINEEFTSPSRLPDKKKAALTLTAAVTVATTATTSSTLVKELITAFASNEVKVDVPTVDAATTPQYQATLVEEDLMPSTTLKPVIQNLQTLESPAEFIQREKMLREEITQLKAMLFEQHLKSNTNQDQLRESAESVITEDMRSSAGLEHLVQDVANESFTSATASVMLSASKTEVLTSSYTNAPISNDNQQQASVERFKPKSMVPAADGSSVIISKSDYDRLLREYDAQELLVRGYETENRRLYALMKSKESEETFKKAQYFDEIQALNIELNRLRNQQHKESLPVDPSDSVPTIGSMDYMKSYAPPTIVPQSVATDADRLRRELALEIAVRDLKEELDTVKNDATQREETLQFDIEKLRSENSSLRETVSTLDSQIVTLSSPDHTDALFTAERTRLQKDNADLKGKLLWYSENQVLIEQVQSSRTELASVVTVLKKELIKAGYRSDAISRLITDASKSVKGGQVSSNDSQVSEIDSTDLKSPVGRKTGARTLSVNRNPSDIKKIRYEYLISTKILISFPLLTFLLILL